MSAATAPTLIEHALTRDLLRGRYAVNSRLPTIRELAELHGVNAATIQRVVARLETRGLITAVQGSGLRVNDPATCGDLSLLPYWLEITLADPPRAATVLADLLEVRRLLAVRLMTRHRTAILGRAPALKERVRQLLAAQSGGLEAIRDADLAFARDVILATGNLVALSIFNTTARVVATIPDVAVAMYADPAENAASMFAVIAALASDQPDLGDVLDRALSEVDRRTVARFEARLTARKAVS
ncbi:MAG: GntR family transcriptional regulator [Myxococcales bacterium]|nr:GntR family transcriptional regulator [Myxococcales bacterium]